MQTKRVSKKGRIIKITIITTTIFGMMVSINSSKADQKTYKKVITQLISDGTCIGVCKRVSEGDKNCPLNTPPKGFVALFNGKDLSGWKGVLARPNDNPIERGKLSPEQLKEAQGQADELMNNHWKVNNGILEFDGKGFSLSTMRDFQDFELLVDWKLLTERGDSGIYLRGAPQVQIWDPAQHKTGSGGLYNNKKNPSKPLATADNPIGEWNTFRIRMIGEMVTVYLNDVLVVDNVILENIWDRSKPIFATGPIELQCHGDPICFRNIFIREIKHKSGWRELFNGKDLSGWTGDTKGYVVEDGAMMCKPGGNLYTVDEFGNFILQFDFKLTPGANNGLGIRSPLEERASYQGMEIQILDDTADKYKDFLKPYQFHGSIYGVVPSRQGCLKPVGQWNHEEVIADGPNIVVILNGHTIVDADIIKASEGGTMDERDHPGLSRSNGHIGFLGHGDQVYFRNIRIKELEACCKTACCSK